MSQSTILHDLYAVIESRKGADPTTSYTAKLLAKGLHKCAQKVGEEGVELALAAVDGSEDDVAGEAADLFYHTLVVLAARDISLDAVFDKLKEREGVSGLAEKAGRKG